MASERRRWPHWAYPTERAWKAAARRQVRDLEKAADKARLGCVYYPGGNGPIDEVCNLVRAMRLRMSVKEWGR